MILILCFVQVSYGRVISNSALKRKNYGRHGINWIYFCDDCDSNCCRKNNIKLQKIMHCSKTLSDGGVVSFAELIHRI